MGYLIDLSAITHETLEHIIGPLDIDPMWRKYYSSVQINEPSTFMNELEVSHPPLPYRNFVLEIYTLKFKDNQNMLHPCSCNFYGSLYSKTHIYQIHSAIIVQLQLLTISFPYRPPKQNFNLLQHML